MIYTHLICLPISGESLFHMFGPVVSIFNVCGRSWRRLYIEMTGLVIISNVCAKSWRRLHIEMSV